MDQIQWSQQKKWNVKENATIIPAILIYAKEK